MSDLEIMPRRKGLSSRRVGITKKWPARTSAPADQPTKRQQTFSSPMVTGESTDSVRLSEQERRIAIKAAWIAAGKLPYSFFFAVFFLNIVFKAYPRLARD